MVIQMFIYIKRIKILARMQKQTACPDFCPNMQMKSAAAEKLKRLL